MSALTRIKEAAKLALYVFRSAITGQYVSADEAKRHPKTTIRERRGR